MNQKNKNQEKLILIFDIEKINYLLCLLMFLLFSLNVNAQSEKITIVGNKVNVRESPNTGAKVLFQLEMRDVCDLLEKGSKEKIGDKMDYWYKISINNKTGWVFGAFTSVAQGTIIPKGNYNDCWGDEESGDSGCGYILTIEKNNGIYSGNIIQGYPDATDGSTFPKQILKNLIIDETSGEISFSFTAFTIIWQESGVMKQSEKELTAKGKITCKAITLNIQGENNYKESMCLIKAN